MNNTEAIIAMAIMGGVTFLTRALPFFLFGGGRRPSRKLLYLGKYLPPAVIAMLVVYSFRAVEPLAWPHGLPELIALACVAGLHIWKRNDLISIFGGTAIYMLLVQVVFA